MHSGAKTCMGDDYSYVGAVVGATYPEMGKVLRKLMPKAYILVPGYGAQGGQGKDLVHFFNEDGLGAIVNSSRGIIAAYKQEKYAKFGEENFADASRAGSRGYDCRYCRSIGSCKIRRRNMAKLKMTSTVVSQEMIATDIYSLWLQCGGNCSTGKARTIHFSVLQGLWKNSSKTNQYL